MCYMGKYKVFRLYGLDNFYYRRCLTASATCLDSLYGLDNFYYRRCRQVYLRIYQGLYGLDNFYYRRSDCALGDITKVYTDLIISTIVDNFACGCSFAWSIRT